MESIKDFDAEQIGARIKELRRNGGEGNRKKMSQEKLAGMLNICRQTLSDCENGDLKLTIEDLVKISRVFNCDIGYLLGEHKERERISADIREETGLSEEAINVIRNCFAGLKPEVIGFLNLLIESEGFVSWAAKSMAYTMELSLLNEKNQHYRQELKGRPKKEITQTLSAINAPKEKELKSDFYQITRDFDKLIEQISIESETRKRAIKIYGNIPLFSAENITLPQQILDAVPTDES